MAFYIGGNKFTARIHDGSTSEKAAPSLTELAQSGKKSNGFYWINPSDQFSQPIYLYCDFDYEANEAYALIIANRINTSNVPNLMLLPLTPANTFRFVNQSAISLQKLVEVRLFHHRRKLVDHLLPLFRLY